MGTNKHENSIDTFFALVRAGLWENSLVHGEGVMVNSLGQVDWKEVYQLAEEQSVIGVALAGIERLKNVNATPNLNIPQEILLQWIGEVQMLEQQNQEMNGFVAEVIEKLRKEDVYTLLLKGQGIAQCYEKPLWRCCGDVDLFLSDDNYKRAKELLVPIASEVEKEYVREKHLGMTIDGFVVELHGTLRCGLSSKVEKGLDEIKKAVFYEGKVRSWMNGRTQVFLTHADEDVVYVFTHMLQHYYKEGLGLRQVCDWCRLLWTYKESLNYGLLESRIRKMGLMSEWRAFGAFAIEYLGMPVEEMPLFDGRSLKEDGRWRKKGKRILEHILKGGPYSKVRDTWAIAKIFPWNTVKFLPAIFLNVNGLKIKERLFVPQKLQK